MSIVSPGDLIFVRSSTGGTHISVVVHRRLPELHGLDSVSEFPDREEFVVKKGDVAIVLGVKDIHMRGWICTMMYCAFSQSKITGWIRFFDQRYDVVKSC